MFNKLKESKKVRILLVDTIEIHTSAELIASVTAVQPHVNDHDPRQ